VLWLYISVADHNATDPVMQKKLQFMVQIFFAHFIDLFLHFQVLFQLNIFLSLL
jgi:hypothetical protein